MEELDENHSCSLKTITTDLKETQTNLNDSLINNTIQKKKISVAHRKLQSLIENGKLEITKNNIKLKNENILLHESLTINEKKKNINDSWFFKKLGSNAIIAEKNRCKKKDEIDVKKKIKIENYNQFKNEIENKLSEKRKEDMERRHNVYNADNEVFSNKDEDEDEEEIEDYDSDLNQNDKIIDSENEDSLCEKFELNKLKRKNSFQNNEKNIENLKRIKFNLTNEDDFVLSTDSIDDENKSNQSLNINNNIQQNNKFDVDNLNDINKTSNIIFDLNNKVNDSTKSQDFKEALLLCSGTFDEKNDLNENNIISTKESILSESENSYQSLSDSFDESDNESFKNDLNENTKKIINLKSEENIEKINTIKNSEICETKNNSFQNLFSDNNLFTVDDNFEDNTQSSANFNSEDESENEEEKNALKQKIKLKDILDDEASLSGDDLDSDLDDESDDENEYEKEEGDDDILPDSEEIRENLVKQYIKQTNDDEERRILRLQEQFFADSDLHVSKNIDRSFRFRMRDDANVDWSKILGKIDEDLINKTESDNDELEDDEEIKKLNGKKIEMLNWKLENEKRKAKFNSSGAESIEIFANDSILSLGEKSICTEVASISTTCVSEEKKIVNFKTQRDSLLNKASLLGYMFKESYKTTSVETQHSLFTSIKKN